jgi:cytochrome c oxidase assembly protein Cox11
MGIPLTIRRASLQNETAFTLNNKTITCNFDGNVSTSLNFKVMPLGTSVNTLVRGDRVTIQILQRREVSG